MVNKNIYIFDIDGTICSLVEHDGDYESVIPFKKRIKKINDLYYDGNKIIYFTARRNE